jgi:hypothetical protein
MKRFLSVVSVRGTTAVGYATELVNSCRGGAAGRRGFAINCLRPEPVSQTVWVL